MVWRPNKLEKYKMTSIKRLKKGLISSISNHQNLIEKGNNVAFNEDALLTYKYLFSQVDKNYKKVIEAVRLIIMNDFYNNIISVCLKNRSEIIKDIFIVIF